MQSYVLIMSEQMIRNNWDIIRQDPDNPRPEITDPEEWIAQAKRGEFKVLGAEVKFSGPPTW